MASAYSSEARTASYVQHLEDNQQLITNLKTEMNATGSHMSDRVLAFTKLFHLYNGDAYAQRSLIVNLEHAALRHKQSH